MVDVSIIEFVKPLERLIQVILASILLTLLSSGCRTQIQPTMQSIPLTETPSATSTSEAIVTPIPIGVTNTPETTPTITPSLTPTTTRTPSDPEGCKTPPDDYTIVKVNGYLFNRRTMAMLEHAADLYQGEIEITGYAITQGSFTNNEKASFGTHAGGGAVDLSVMKKGTFNVARDEIMPLIRALRISGFAAWLRDLNELYSGSPIHIHAVAVGDKQLSRAAQEQIYGSYGYFKGFSGIPPKGNPPAPDRFGGPIICEWMRVGINKFNTQ